MIMLINELRKIPFLRLLIPFVLGLITGNFFALPLYILFTATAICIGLSFIYSPLITNNLAYSKNWIFGSLISLSIFFIAYSHTINYNTIDTKIENAETILGIVDEPPKKTARSIKIILKTLKYEKNNSWVEDNSLLLIYMAQDSLSKSLKYGDIISIKGNLRAITNAGNPNEFDYKKYLHRQRIYFQAYTKSNQWILLDRNRGNFLYTFSYNIRNEILTIYKKAGISGDEFAILSALTLGVKDYLSDDIVKNYSHSGAMHVLAVSGLHVGIITMMLNFLLSFFRKKAKLRIVHTVAVICFLWIFAIITGLTPSVTRSALMFSFFVVGSNSNRKPHSLNSLAASAFIILSFNPNALFYVGFQLSFLAVTSILLFQKPISKLLIINNFVGNEIWQLTSVSIAAQIGTTPISIYYFHQFPVYALLTNIIVIPAAMLIMYITVLLILVSFVSSYASYVAIFLSFVIKMLNQSTQFIEHLPFSSIEFISLNSAELIISYAIIILLAIMFATQNKKLLFMVLLLLISIFAIRDFRYLKNLNNNRLIVFKTNKNSAIASIKGLNMTLYADTAITNNKQNISYLCANIITENAITHFKTEKLPLDSSSKFPVVFIDANIAKVAYLQGKIDRFKSDKKISLDYIILGGKSSINIEYITDLFDCKYIIIDASMPKWKQKLIKRDCINQNIQYFNISDEEAFVLNNQN